MNVSFIFPVCQYHKIVFITRKICTIVMPHEAKNFSVDKTQALGSLMLGSIIKTTKETEY